jgi:hypothetical protein
LRLRCNFWRWPAPPLRRCPAGNKKADPSHSNKDGVRYRYYVSHVLLQRRKKSAGHVTRVPAIQLEKLVVEAIRAKAWPDTELKGSLSDRGVIDRYVTGPPPAGASMFLIYRNTALPDVPWRQQSTENWPTLFAVTAGRHLARSVAISAGKPPLVSTPVTQR